MEPAWSKSFPHEGEGFAVQGRGRPFILLMYVFPFSFSRIHNGWLNWSQFFPDTVFPSGPLSDIRMALVSIVLKPLIFFCIFLFSHILGVAIFRGSIFLCLHWVPWTPKPTHSPSSLWQTWTLCWVYGVIWVQKTWKDYFTFVPNSLYFCCSLNSDFMSWAQIGQQPWMSERSKVLDVILTNPCNYMSSPPRQNCLGVSGLEVDSGKIILWVYLATTSIYILLSSYSIHWLQNLANLHSRTFLAISHLCWPGLYPCCCSCCSSPILL